MSVALPARARARGDLGARVAPLEYAIVAIVLFFAANAIVPSIFNPHADLGAPVTNDPVSEPLRLTVLAFALAMTVPFGARMLLGLLRTPALPVLVVLAIGSSLWSDAPSISFAHAVDLAISTLFGAYVGARFSLRQIAQVVSHVLLAILVASIAFVLLRPELGLDHAHDLVWRGAFITKNELGRMMVFGAVVWAARVADRHVSAPAGAAAALAFIGAALASGSRTALALLIGISLLAVAVRLLGDRSRARLAERGFALMAGLLAGAGAIASLGILLHIVGADSSLTGRTGIWSASIDALRVHPWLGYGYDAFWRGLDGPSAAVWQAVHGTPPHSHNGFLDLSLGLGVLGLFVFAQGFVHALVRARRAARATQLRFPLAFISVFLLYNLTESSLVSRRSLEWTVFVAIAVALSLRPGEQAR